MNHQRVMIKFLRKYPGKWHSFAADRQTVELVCSLHNLGIATVKGDQFILRSAEKADQYLNARHD